MSDTERCLPIAAKPGRAPVRRGDQHRPVGDHPLGVTGGRSNGVHVPHGERQRPQGRGLAGVRSPTEEQCAGDASRRCVAHAGEQIKNRDGRRPRIGDRDQDPPVCRRDHGSERRPYRASPGNQVHTAGSDAPDGGSDLRHGRPHARGCKLWRSRPGGGRRRRGRPVRGEDLRGGAGEPSRTRRCCPPFTRPRERWRSGRNA